MPCVFCELRKFYLFSIDSGGRNIKRILYIFGVIDRLGFGSVLVDSGIIGVLIDTDQFSKRTFGGRSRLHRG
ncbi:hypothetical protein CH370_18850 [Leptospira kmetyi]|nr:hypothetical protein CH370_18850 [Leptospira kmetyi]